MINTGKLAEVRLIVGSIVRVNTCFRPILVVYYKISRVLDFCHIRSLFAPDLA